MILADPAVERPTGILKEPGDFYRNAQGSPYVVDPSGAVVKSGERKGLPKLLPYGRPSGFGEQIADMWGITKWGERNIVLGLGTKWIEMGGDVADLADPRWNDCPKEWKAEADRIIIAAKQAANADLDADRGTHIHKLIETGHYATVDLLDEGVALGIPAAVQAELLDQFAKMIDEHDFEVLRNEAHCVNDPLRLAGTLDMIVRLRRELRLLGPGGEVVVLPAGTVLVLDIKAGRLRVDNGRIQYWRDYPIQIAAYAGSVPYDCDTDTRGEWPWPINQDWALIAHLNTREAIAGEPAVCSLVLVDIAAGRAACDIVVAAKSWEKQTSSMTLQPSKLADVGVERVSPASATPDREVLAPPPVAAAPAPARAVEQPSSATVEASPASAVATMSRADCVAALGIAPDDGATGVDFKLLEAMYYALPAEARSWFNAIVKQSEQASVSFRANTTRTVRRHDLYHGLLHLAANDYCDDDIVRALVALALDSDAPLFPCVTVGHAVGACGVGEAKSFALWCDEYVAGGNLVVDCSDGLLRLVAA